MRNRIPGGFDMNVNILTSGYWPSYPIVDAKMPAELSDYQQARPWRHFVLLHCTEVQSHLCLHVAGDTHQQGDRRMHKSLVVITTRT